MASEEELEPTELGLYHLFRKIRSPVSYKTGSTADVIYTDLDDLLTLLKHTLVVDNFSLKKNKEMVNSFENLVIKVKLYDVGEEKYFYTQAKARNTKKLIDLFLTKKEHTMSSWLCYLRTERCKILNGWVTLFTTRKGLCLDALKDFYFFNRVSRYVMPCIQEEGSDRVGIFGMQGYMWYIFME